MNLKINEKQRFNSMLMLNIKTIGVSLGSVSAKSKENKMEISILSKNMTHWRMVKFLDYR